MKGEKLEKGVIIIICLMPLIRIATYFLMPGSRGAIGMMIHTGGDSILMGCLIALIEKSSWFQDKMMYLRNKLFITGAIIFLFIISPTLTIYFKGNYNLLFGISLQNIAIAIFLLWCVYIPTKFSNLLNSSVFVKIGVLSYSLYIWHIIFLRNPNGLWIYKFPFNIICAFTVAFASHYLVEKPILRLKKRFTYKNKKKLSRQELSKQLQTS